VKQNFTVARFVFAVNNWQHLLGPLPHFGSGCVAPAGSGAVKCDHCAQPMASAK